MLTLTEEKISKDLRPKYRLIEVDLDPEERQRSFVCFHLRDSEGPLRLYAEARDLSVYLKELIKEKNGKA